MRWAERIGRRVKLRDLHVLQAVAQAGSMSKGARDLAISIPVVSKTIADLEHTVGFRLLDRTPHGVEPTRYGQALIARSSAAFAELRQGISDIEFLADPSLGELRIGCTEAVASGPAFAVMDRLTRQHPRIVFDVVTGRLATLYQNLAERNVELVMAGIAGPVPEELHVESLFEDSFVVAAGLENPWARRRRIKLAELVNEPWTLMPPDTAAGALFLQAFRASGLEAPRTSIISVSLNLRNRLLATGRFLTMVAGYTLSDPNKYPSLKALPVELPNVRRTVAILALRNRTLSPLAELFLKTAREIANSLAKTR